MEANLMSWTQQLKKFLFLAPEVAEGSFNGNPWGVQTEM